MRKTLLTCFSLLVILAASSQNNANVLQAVYAPDSSSSVYNGIEHLGYPASIEGTPYYLNDEWQPGTLVYRDQTYTGVHLKYDLLKNELILRHYNGFTGVTLFTPRIQSFTIGNNRFINLPEQDGKPSGIFEEVITGKVSLYVKRTKKMDERVSIQGIERRISSGTSYFLMKDGVFQQVRNEKSALDFLKDQRNAVRSHLREKGLKYRRNADVYLFEAITFYNQSSR